MGRRRLRVLKGGESNPHDRYYLPLPNITMYVSLFIFFTSSYFWRPMISDDFLLFLYDIYGSRLIRVVGSSLQINSSDMMHVNALVLYLQLPVLQIEAPRHSGVVHSPQHELGCVIRCGIPPVLYSTHSTKPTISYLWYRHLQAPPLAAVSRWFFGSY